MSKKIGIVFHGQNSERLSLIEMPVETMKNVAAATWETYEKEFSHLPKDEFRKMVFQTSMSDIEKIHADGYERNHNDFVNVCTAVAIHEGFDLLLERGDNVITFGGYTLPDGRLTFVVSVNDFDLKSPTLLEEAAGVIEYSKQQADRQASLQGGEIKSTNLATPGWEMFSKSTKRSSLNTNSRPKKKRRVKKNRR